jgi:2-haloacid dehalogenase
VSPLQRCTAALEADRQDGTRQPSGRHVVALIMPAPTKSIQAVVFDAYGTLFDVHSVATRCDQIFPGRGAELSKLWRSKQLEYTWLRSLMERYQDFESITGAALIYSCRAMSLSLDDHARLALLEEYRRLAPYPEVPAALQSLGGRKLAILSNGSPGMLQAMVSHAGFASAFHAVLSVHPLRIFKPHPKVYQLAVDELGVTTESIAFVSSNFWDVTGATSFGFQTFWINRSGAEPDELGYRPAGVLERLDQLTAVLN